MTSVIVIFTCAWPQVWVYASLKMPETRLAERHGAVPVSQRAREQLKIEELVASRCGDFAIEIRQTLVSLLNTLEILRGSGLRSDLADRFGRNFERIKQLAEAIESNAVQPKTADEVLGMLYGIFEVLERELKPVDIHIHPVSRELLQRVVLISESILKSVFGHLVRHAVLKKGAQRIDVRCEAASFDGEELPALKIVVTDDGEGLTPEALKAACTCCAGSEHELDGSDGPCLKFVRGHIEDRCCGVVEVESTHLDTDPDGHHTTLSFTLPDVQAALAHSSSTDAPAPLPDEAPLPPPEPAPAPEPVTEAVPIPVPVPAPERAPDSASPAIPSEAIPERRRIFTRRRALYALAGTAALAAVAVPHLTGRKNEQADAPDAPETASEGPPPPLSDLAFDAQGRIASFSVLGADGKKLTYRIGEKDHKFHDLRPFHEKEGSVVAFQTEAGNAPAFRQFLSRVPGGLFGQILHKGIPSYVCIPEERMQQAQVTEKELFPLRDTLFLGVIRKYSSMSIALATSKDLLPLIPGLDRLMNAKLAREQADGNSLSQAASVMRRLLGVQRMTDRMRVAADLEEWRKFINEDNRFIVAEAALTDQLRPELAQHERQLILGRKHDLCLRGVASDEAKAIVKIIR
jgi:hypothetical protein